MRPVSRVVGGVIAVLGVVFLLQGLDVLGGSGMSGKSLWVVLGAIIAVAGLYVALRGGRAVPADDA